MHEVKRRRRSYAILFAVGATAQFMSPACSSERDRTVSVASVPGRLELELTAVTPSGNVYRLRQGVLSLRGESTGFETQVSTEDDPGRSALLLELPVDRYEVYLAPGFYLERLSPAASASLARRRAAERASAPRTAGRNGGSVPAPVEAPDASAPGAPEAPPPFSPGGGVVEATLVSANPARVNIASDAVTRLDFVFSVGGELVQTGTGVLGIGIDVVEGDGCAPDAFEPNDDPSQAAPITPGVSVDARMCPGDYDVFTFEAPVPAGEPFSVTLWVARAPSDIVARLVSLASDLDVGSIFGFAEQEVVVVASDGGAYRLELYSLGGGNAGDYRIEIGALGPVSNDCCTTSPLPGCTDAAVLECVCANDPYCCENAFDDLCVQGAALCGNLCQAPESDCCSTSEVPGCTDTAVTQCTCAQDAACCSSGWDDVCVTQAVTGCALQCPGVAASSDCCSATAEPGCLEPELEQCVCAIDPYCCIGSFDDNCVALANTQCGASCNRGGDEP